MSDAIEIDVATAGDESAVVSLWEVCGLVSDHNPPEADFNRAISSPCSTVFIARHDTNIVGTVLAGDDGHRAWIYYLASHPDQRKRGLGKRLVEKAEAWATDRGARKIQLMIRPSNDAVRTFYTSAGYQETPRLVMAKWLDKEMAENPPKDRT